MEELYSISTIRYNWNTEGFVKTKDYGEYKIFVPNNTGALNISLFDSSNPNDEVKLSKELEEIANHYFANLNNSDVARVVQYIYLYQLFKLNDISYSYNKPSAKDKSGLLVDDARFVLTKIKNLTDKDLTKFSHDVAKFNYYQYVKPYRIKKRWERWEVEYEDSTKLHAEKNGIPVDEYILTAGYTQMYEKARENMSQYIEDWFKEEDGTLIADLEKKMTVFNDILDLQNEVKRINPSEFDKLCQIISFPNGRYYKKDSLIFIKANNINMKAGKIQQYYAFLGIDLETVKNNYVMSLQNDSCRWIKTPKVVVTSNTFRNYDTAYATDCYNLLSGPTGGHKMSVEETTQPVDSTENPVPKDSKLLVKRRPQVDRRQDVAGGKSASEAAMLPFNGGQPKIDRRGLARIEPFKHSIPKTEFDPIDIQKEKERRKLSASEAVVLWQDDAMKAKSRDAAFYCFTQATSAYSQKIGKINTNNDKSTKIKKGIWDELKKQEIVEDNKKNLNKNISDIDKLFRQKIEDATNEQERTELKNDYSRYNNWIVTINKHSRKIDNGPQSFDKTLNMQEKIALFLEKTMENIEKYPNECPSCKTIKEETINNANRIIEQRIKRREELKRKNKL
jgi:hypothetical protein